MSKIPGYGSNGFKKNNILFSIRHSVGKNGKKIVLLKITLSPAASTLQNSSNKKLRSTHLAELKIL